MPYTPITLPIQNPLLTLQAAISISGQPADELLARVEDGSIRFAFNIATRRQGRRRCLRLFTKSLAEYLEHGRRLCVENPGQAAAEITALFSAVEDRLRADAFARLLGCPTTHVSHLAQGRAIKLVRAGRCGPGGSALLDRKSCIEFLLERRITG